MVGKTISHHRGLDKIGKAEWSTELGPEDFAQLKEVLLRAWERPLTGMQRLS